MVCHGKKENKILDKVALCPQAGEEASWPTFKSIPKRCGAECQSVGKALDITTPDQYRKPAFHGAGASTREAVARLPIHPNGGFKSKRKEEKKGGFVFLSCGKKVCQARSSADFTLEMKADQRKKKIHY